MTADTCGPKCGGSLSSSALQSSLESRLVAALDVNGSPEYELKWKHWDMQSGPPICALRARARPTLGSGCTGWRTPDSVITQAKSNVVKYSGRTPQDPQVGLADQVALVGWPTPQTFDATGDGMPRPLRYKGNAPSEQGNTRRPDTRGSYRGDLKDYVAMAGVEGAGGLAGWPTPNALPESRGGLQSNPEKALERKQQGHQLNLDDAATLAVSPPVGWATPSANEMRTVDAERLRERREECRIRTNNGNGFGLTLGNQATLYLASTDTPAASQLNPRFSLWLQGYPIEWACCGEAVIASSRRRRQRS